MALRKDCRCAFDLLFLANERQIARSGLEGTASSLDHDFSARFLSASGYPAPKSTSAVTRFTRQVAQRRRRDM